MEARSCFLSCWAGKLLSLSSLFPFFSSGCSWHSRLMIWWKRSCPFVEGCSCRTQLLHDLTYLLRRDLQGRSWISWKVKGKIVRQSFALQWYTFARCSTYTNGSVTLLSCQSYGAKYFLFSYCSWHTCPHSCFSFGHLLSYRLLNYVRQTWTNKVLGLFARIPICIYKILIHKRWFFLLM